MYTSGSTGKPKGCIVPSSGLWAHFSWAIEVQALTPADVFVLKTTCAFDVSIHEMWVPLLHGCTSVVLEEGGQLDFDKVRRRAEPLPRARSARLTSRSPSPCALLPCAPPPPPPN